MTYKKMKPVKDRVSLTSGRKDGEKIGKMSQSLGLTAVKSYFFNSPSFHFCQVLSGGKT